MSTSKEKVGLGVTPNGYTYPTKVHPNSILIEETKSLKVDAVDTAPVFIGLARPV